MSLGGLEDEDAPLTEQEEEVVLKGLEGVVCDLLPYFLPLR